MLEKEAVPLPSYMRGKGREDRGARAKKEVTPEQYKEFERKCREKELEELKRDRRRMAHPAFKPPGSALAAPSTAKSGQSDSSYRSAKYTPVVWRTPAVVSHSRARQRKEAHEPDPAEVELKERRARARPVSHIGGDEDAKPKLKPKHSCFDSVYMDLRQSALASLRQPPKVSCAAALDGRLKAVLPTSVDAPEKLVGHTTPTRPYDSKQLQAGAVFLRCGNGAFQEYAITGIDINAGTGHARR